MIERRKDLRVPLDTPVFVTLLTESGKELFCLMKDISLGGAMVALPPEMPDGAVVPGEALTISEPPEGLFEELGNTVVHVAWVKPGAFGVAFSSILQLTQEKLEQRLNDSVF